MSYPIIQHPLPLNTSVRATSKGCACRGGQLEVSEGTILKVITNAQGYWYYLSNGRTVKDAQVQSIN